MIFTVNRVSKLLSIDVDFKLQLLLGFRENMTVLLGKFALLNGLAENLGRLPSATKIRIVTVSILS